MTAPDDEVEREDELESFRSEWREEVARRQRVPPITRSAASLPSPVAPRLPTLEEHWDPVRQDEDVNHQQSSVVSTPVDDYERAVRSEREGRLNDALRLYRQAFRADPDVDKAWHRATQLHLQRPPSPPLRIDDVSAPVVSRPLADTFTFERTVQVTPDYVADKERRTQQLVKRHGLSGRDDEHPSSTRFLLTSLLKSFEKEPWIPIGARAEAGFENLSLEEKSSSTPFVLRFHPEDEELPVHLNKLPPEVLILVIRHVVLSSVIPPRSESYLDASSLLKGKGRQVRLTIKEEREMLELEMGLEQPVSGWKTDVEALERFARSCRAARVLTLNEGLWRDLCFTTYVPPHQISKEEEASEIVSEQHAGDYRRCFIEHPRLRLDGAYIAVVTYHRPGDAAQAWYSPSHVVTFYRYLRFYPSGLAISYLTVEPPEAVVKQLNPMLKIKGLARGRWRLRGDMVECWGLRDSTLKHSEMKYTFRMTCRLRSTARGRMNKLEMISLATEKRTTGELEDLPIRPTKPFFFSKVNSYAGLDE